MNYAEPWTLREDEKTVLAFRDSNGSIMINADQRARAVACVNALAGKEPSALSALEGAAARAHDLLKNDVIHTSDADSCPACAVALMLRTALRVYRGETC